MNRLLTSIVIACGVTASTAAWAQGGYTVMGNAPAQAPVVVASPTTAPPPAPTLVAPGPASAPGAVEQITPSHERAPRGVASPVVARRPDEYGGVTPGMPALPPGLRRARRPGGVVRVAWPGFQMVPGGSRVFVVLTAQQPVVEASRNGRVRVYHIPSAGIMLSNNRRALITEAFATPVSRAFLRPGRGGTDLVVELRADVEPTVSQETNAQGFHYVFVNFQSFAAPEIARLHMPNGAVVSVPPPAPRQITAPAPQVQIGTPHAAPGTDNERPPGMH
jgi:hypothetical protein